MSKSKQRLRPWMEDQLNSGQFPGVEWIDRENKIFKLPWKHYGRQDRKESDGLIFMVGLLVCLHSKFLLFINQFILFI